jgi:hypothetical protein
MLSNRALTAVPVSLHAALLGLRSLCGHANVLWAAGMKFVDGAWRVDVAMVPTVRVIVEFVGYFAKQVRHCS